MVALFPLGAWTSMYLRGLFFNGEVRVYNLKGVSIFITVKAEMARPVALRQEWGKGGHEGWGWDWEWGQGHIGYCRSGVSSPSKQKRSQPLAMTEFRGLRTSQCHLIISKPKSLILLLSEPPHMETSSRSWLTHRNLMFRKSLSCPHKQFHHNNLASGSRGSFKFCSAWFTIKI